MKKFYYIIILIFTTLVVINSFNYPPVIIITIIFRDGYSTLVSNSVLIINTLYPINTTGTDDLINYITISIINIYGI